MDVHFADGYSLFDISAYEYINELDTCSISIYIRDPNLNLVELNKHLTADNLRSFIIMTRDDKYHKTLDGYTKVSRLYRSYDKGGEFVLLVLSQE